MAQYIGYVTHKNQDMTDEMEKLIEPYYEDSIELSDRKLLSLKRVTNYKCTDRRAVKVLLEDLENETTVELVTYFDAKWIFSSPMNERVFWQHVKQNQEQFIEVFNRMRVPVPSQSLHAYKLSFAKSTHLASSKISKLTAIFRGDGKNV